MAPKLFLSFVVGKADVAVYALGDISAGFAQQIGSVAPSILKQDHLLFLLETLNYGLIQNRGKNTRTKLFGALNAHIR